MNPRPLFNLFRSNVAGISAPTKGTVTKNSIVVTGTVEWYKDGATWGVAYKKNSASDWSYQASTSKSINETLTSLTASTKYNIKLYVLFDGEYQYGDSIDVTTSAS
jgi:hypothetical protein